MKKRAIWLVMVWGCLAQAAWASPDEAVVGDIGNPPQLIVQGAETFPPQEVADALLGDLDLACAMYPAAPLGEFCRLLVAKTVEGYRHAGFGDVSAQVAVDDSRQALELTIVEGPRYRQGDIRVIGGKAIDGAAIRDRLLQGLRPDNDTPGTAPAAAAAPSAPAESPEWFATFGERDMAIRREQIAAVILDQGWMLAEFTVVPLRHRADKTSTLLISIEDDGKPAVLDAITITGNKKNSVPEILDYLGIQEGMPYRAHLEREVRERLSHSGRFIKSTVELTRPRAPGESLKLAIELEEYEKTPRLKLALSREEAALAAAGVWLAGFDESSEEMMLRVTGKDFRIEAITSAKRGVVGTARSAGGSAERRFELSFAMTDDFIAFYSPNRRRKIEAIPVPHRVIGNVEFRLHRGPPKANANGAIQFGLGMKWSPRKFRPCQIKFDANAIDLLSLAHEHDAAFSWENDLLTVTYKTSELTVEAKSGRVLTWRGVNANGLTIEITRCADKLAARLSEFKTLAAEWPNDAQADRPISCALEFACEEALADDAIHEAQFGRELALALSKCGKSGILSPLDRWLGNASRARDPLFTVSSIDIDLRVRNPFAALIQSCAEDGIRLSGRLAPPGSWLWTDWRQAMFLIGSKPGYLGHEIYRQCSSLESGPLQFLALGTMMQMLGEKEVAKLCGLRGLERLTADAFRADCRPLLNDDTLFGECVLTTARVLAQLNEDEIRVLCEAAVEGESLSEDSAKRVAEFAKLLRESKEESAQGRVTAALDGSWSAGLRDYLEVKLWQLVGPAETASLLEPPPKKKPTDDKSAEEKSPLDDPHPFGELHTFGRSKTKRR